MKAKSLIALIVLCLSSSITAETIVEREITGYGKNRDEAIKDGLYQAVAQVQGVQVGSGDYRFGYSSAAADVNNVQNGKRIEFDAVSVETAGSVLSTHVSGLVKSYEVLEEGKTNDGYRAKLKVFVLDYASGDNVERVRVAVMPIRALKKAFNFGFIMPGDDIAAQLSQKLTAGLVATNKFTVLDREYGREFAREKSLLKSDGSLQELSKLNEALGSDYILTGTISDAVLIKRTRTLAAIGREVDDFEARFVFDYRLSGGPTRHIKAADTVELELEMEDIKSLYEKWESDDADVKEIGDKIIAKAAKQAVEKIMEQFYSIKVAALSPTGRIIIDQGRDRVSAGQQFNLIARGQAVIDQDTGEQLAVTEVAIGVIEVEHVLPKIAYANLIEGDLSKVSAGLICSRVAGTGPENIGRKATVDKIPGAGVKLPFD